MGELRIIKGPDLALIYRPNHSGFRKPRWLLYLGFNHPIRRFHEAVTGVGKGGSSPTPVSSE